MLTPDLQQELLNNIAENVKEAFHDPRFAEQNEKFGNVAESLNELFQLQRHNANVPNAEWVNPEGIQLSNALAFEMSVINSVMLKDMFNDGIDDFFNDPHTASIFADMTDKQKEQSRRQLKNLVAERLDVTPTTEQGALYKGVIENEYKKEVISKNGDKAALRADFAQNIAEPLNRTLRFVRAKGTTIDLAGALQTIKDQQQNAPYYTQATMACLANHSAMLASEKGAMQRFVNDVILPITRDVNPAEFVEHYNSNTLTLEEINWAVGAFDDAHKGFAPDYASFKKGDQPLFNDAELNIADLNPALSLGLKVKAIAETLSGNDISEINHTKSTRELFHPQIVDKRRENASFFDIIVDFIKDLLGINTKQKQIEQAKIEEIQNTANANKAAYHGNISNESREQISFSELSAENMVDKVTNPPEKSRSLTKDFSRGR